MPRAQLKLQRKEVSETEVFRDLLFTIFWTDSFPADIWEAVCESSSDLIQGAITAQQTCILRLILVVRRAIQIRGVLARDLRRGSCGRQVERLCILTRP